MIESATLIENVIGTLAAAGVSKTSGVVVDWLKRKFGSATANAAESVVRSPESNSAKDTLKSLLSVQLKASPDDVQELSQLMHRIRSEHAPQTISVKGDGNISVQIQGDSNER